LSLSRAIRQRNDFEGAGVAAGRRSLASRRVPGHSTPAQRRPVRPPPQTPGRSGGLLPAGLAEALNSPAVSTSFACPYRTGGMPADVEWSSPTVERVCRSPHAHFTVAVAYSGWIRTSLGPRWTSVEPKS
jgi:hypothetical protein